MSKPLIYSEMRRLIHSGDPIAFTHEKSHSWYDKKVQAVMHVTKSPLAHFGLAWVVGDRVMIFEAVQPLVRIFPLSKMGDFYWYPRKSKLSEAGLTEAMRQVGFEYSQPEAILAQWGFNNRDNDVTSCVEYVKKILSVDGVILPGRDTPAVADTDLQDMGIPRFKVHNDS